MATSNIGTVGAATALLDEVPCIIGRITTPAVLDTLDQYTATLSELRTTLNVLHGASNHNIGHLGAALGQLQDVQQRLIDFLRGLEPQAEDLECRFPVNWDPDKLQLLMSELAAADLEVQRRSRLFPEATAAPSSEIDNLIKLMGNLTASSSSRDIGGETRPDPEAIPELARSKGTQVASDHQKTTPLFPISFNGNSLAMREVRESPTEYIVIQTATPLGLAATRYAAKELSDIGLTLLQRISENTYLFRRRGLKLEEIRQLPYVVFACVYYSNLKISSNLKTGRDSNPLDIFHTVDVIFHEDVYPDHALVREIVRKAHSAHRSGNVEISEHKVRFRVQQRFIEDIASVDQVQTIERVLTIVPRTWFARQTLRAGVAIPHVSARYEGKGQVVAVADTGFDRGNIRYTHPAFNKPPGGQFKNRVLTLYPMSDLTSLSDFNGHRTLVCALAVGNGPLKKENGGVSTMKGTAPQAELVVQCLGHDFNGVPTDLTDLFRIPFHNNHARVHTDCWGASWRGEQEGYNSSSREIDGFVWDHPDMVICWAAGNDGGSNKHHRGKQIGAEAAAKNCITVGASRKELPRRDEMLSLSSRGPTKEGRVKPDVVAPGEDVISVNSGHRAYPHFGREPNLFDTSWAYDSGTSMSTALVAGCAAVVREALIANGTEKPSAALIKALLTNGVVNLHAETSSHENYESGFGRVDLANSIAMACRAGTTGFHEGDLNLSELPCQTISIQIFSPGRFKVTLTWADYPGEQLQNKLYLVVQASNKESRHTHGSGERFSIRNNNQQLIWDQIPAGATTITIWTYEIIQPASNPHQPYACAWQLF